MRRAVIIAGFALLAAACSESDRPPNGDGAAEARAVDPNTVAARAALTDDFDATYAAYFDALVEAEPLRTVLLDPVEPVPIERRRFLGYLYAARDFAPFLVVDGVPGAGAEALVAALETVGDHGLSPGRYLSDDLLAALDLQRQLVHARPSLPHVSATAEERSALVGFTETLDTGSGATAAATLAAALDDDATDSPVPELRAAHRQRLDFEHVFRGNGAIVEALLVDAVLAYAFDQRNFNTAWVDEEMDEEARHQWIADRTDETFQQLASVSDEASAQAFFVGLQPQHAQYALLLEERIRYAAIVEAGGWDRIDPVHLERGSSGDAVSALQARLAAEGYYDGEPTGEFDESVEEAVRAYQQTHQMEVTGASNRGFWNSINISAEQRLAQIDLTMQRWRESRIGDDPYYVFVNVPDFHAEVWKDGERAMRFRIVTGNTTQVCDPRTGQTTYANATPLQSAEMTYVVLNPMWNVPRRIVEEEVLPEALADPTYLKTHGFERYTTPGGIEIIRQLPGPENPLGRVKFMFPNPHNTYLHDTSRPQYFRYSVRAFSHGCMRVSQPIELLEYVLTQDGQWDEDRINEIFESQEETTMGLRTPIPVHVEYYVVRVDDDGRANFLADIYRYDRDRLSPPDPSSLECEPDAEGQPRLVLGEDYQVRYRDDEGNTYTADQWDYVQGGGTLEQRPDGSFVDPPAGTIGRDLDEPAVPDDITEGDFGP